MSKQKPIQPIKQPTPPAKKPATDYVAYSDDE
jgi:hypothetical protein